MAPPPLFDGPSQLPGARQGRISGTLLLAFGLELTAFAVDVLLRNDLVSTVLYAAPLVLLSASQWRTAPGVLAATASALGLVAMAIAPSSPSWGATGLQRVLMLVSIWSVAGLCRVCQAALLARREADLRHLAWSETAADAVLLLEDGRIQAVNTAGLLLLGASSNNQVVGRAMLDFIRPPDREQFAQRLERFRTESAAPTIPQILIGLDGGEIEAELSAAPLLEQGRWRMQLVLRDVRELMRLVESLRRAEDQMCQAQRFETVARLSAGVAHDFNNMLCVVASAAEQLEEGANLDEAQRRGVREISVAVQWSMQLARRLALFSRGRLSSPELLNLNTVIGEMEPLLHQFSKSNVRLDLSLSFDLGRIMLDRAQAAQVVLNLAVNAADAMPEGGVLRIETRNCNLDREQSAGASATTGADPSPSSPGPEMFVALIVTDTGSGLSPETKRRMFEPCFTTKESGRGTGLGLATVWWIVQQGKGCIRVDSEEGVGTTFVLYFPRAEFLDQQHHPRCDNAVCRASGILPQAMPLPTEAVGKAESN